MKDYSTPLFDYLEEQPVPAIPFNPTVAESDKPRLNKAHRALLQLLSDHAWHANSELMETAGMRFGARLEELRKAGHAIVTEPRKGGTYVYRLLDRGT